MIQEKLQKPIENVAGSKYWFRDTPHRWASASFPLAYAVACVEVVCRNPEKARMPYSLLAARICHH